MPTEIIGLQKLREPFPANQISKLPKGTKTQNECPPAEKINCKVCGGWHHPKVVHLDYVGHAALTDRLLDADPLWNWDFLSVGADGYPVIDKDGGMWIKLTVCGITRFGYGDAQGKTGANAMKERIGDALRNAAMRFGAALDLWHKGDLHTEEDPPPPQSEQHQQQQQPGRNLEWYKKSSRDECKTPDELTAWWKDHAAEIGKLSPADQKAITSHCSALKKEMAAKQSSAPQTVDCPLGGKVVKNLECKECPNTHKCPNGTGETKEA